MKCRSILTPLLPAATTTVTPEATVDSTAELTAAEYEPPSDILRTARRGSEFATTHCMPLRTREFVPSPFASRTLTATRLAAYLVLSIRVAIFEKNAWIGTYLSQHHRMLLPQFPSNVFRVHSHPY